MLADNPAGVALGDPEPIDEHVDCSPTTVRGQKFPSASSLSIDLSSSASARSFLSRWFSFSSSLRRLASSAFMPPYWFRQRCQVCSEISRCLETSSIVLPSARSFSPSASLRITCSGVCRRCFILCCPPRPILGHRTHTRGGLLQRDPVRLESWLAPWRASVPFG